VSWTCGSVRSSLSDSLGNLCAEQLFRSVNVRRRGVVAENTRLTAFIQRQLCIDRIAQTDIEIAAVSELEIHFRTVIAILKDPHLANYLADQFFTVDHAISRFDWSQKNIPTD